MTNWRQRQVLLGKCKWDDDEVGREVMANARCAIESLVNVRGPRVAAKLEGEGWQMHFVFFARSGFTPAARALAANVSARLVDLAELDAELGGHGIVRPCAGS